MRTQLTETEFPEIRKIAAGEYGNLTLVSEEMFVLETRLKKGGSTEDLNLTQCMESLETLERVHDIAGTPGQQSQDFCTTLRNLQRLTKRRA